MANPEKIVTRELVFEVAGRLKAAGIEPSNRKVLHDIGGGSMATIAGHLRDWKAKQEISAQAPVEAAPVPPAVMDTGAQAVAMIWQTCTAEARRDVVRVTEDANQRIKAAEDERDSALNELAEAEAELTTALQKNATLAADLDRERDQSRQLQEANGHLQAEAEKAAAVADEVKQRAATLAEGLNREREQTGRLQAENKQKDRELEQLRTVLSQTNAELVEARQQAAVLAEKLQAATDRASKAEASVEEFSRQAAQVPSLQTKVEALEAATQQQTRELDAARAALIEANTARASAESKAVAASEAAAELRGKLAAIKEQQQEAVPAKDKTKADAEKHAS